MCAYNPGCVNHLKHDNKLIFFKGWLAHLFPSKKFKFCRLNIYCSMYIIPYTE